MARFTQYAMAASHEALEDAEWTPQSDEDKQATVSTVPVRRGKDNVEVHRVFVWVLV